MIAVIADSAEEQAVREFFELFKTPWEFYRRGRRYDVLLCAGSGEFDEAVKTVILYSGRELDFDHQQGSQGGSERRSACVLSWQGRRLPIYGDTLTFPERRDDLLRDEGSHGCVAYLDRSSERVLVRIGYDLFREVKALLTAGQPATNANIPALDLHIAFLRNLITACGSPLAEIPPVPDGYRFIACLTHDVDHPSIRQHKWDHTTFGFLYRATFGSLRNLIRGRMCPRDLLENWAAALKLPFVYLGLARDFWREFDDRYLELEEGLRSTFFVIPFQNRAGNKADGTAPALRAARYGAQDVADKMQKLLAAGCEVALHGIDAWIDTSRANEEFEEIRRLTGVSEIGVRMHWLYFDEQSPLALERAGAAYDSTVGYNNTIGYRAGTTQVYRPLGACRLLELPLHVMDTALFYPAYLGLSPRQAMTLLGQMVNNAGEFGGCLTVNWHDRSTAPERMWGASYRELLQDMRGRGVWFATAQQAASWFRKRRSAVFELDSAVPGGVRASAGSGPGDALPGLRLRIHRARGSFEIGAGCSPEYIDVCVGRSVDGEAPCDVADEYLRS